MYFYIRNQKSKIKGDLWYQSKTTSKHQNIISKTILKVILLYVWTSIFSYQPLCLEHELLVSCWTYRPQSWQINSKSTFHTNIYWCAVSLAKTFYWVPKVFEEWVSLDTRFTVPVNTIPCSLCLGSSLHKNTSGTVPKSLDIVISEVIQSLMELLNLEAATTEQILPFPHIFPNKLPDSSCYKITVSVHHFPRAHTSVEQVWTKLFWPPVTEMTWNPR